MTNDVIETTDNRLLASPAPQRPLDERLLELTDADLRMIQGQGRRGAAFGHSFDNGFNNAFKNIA